MPACYRHPNRETGVSCSSCGRPICPDCMTPTPVGMRCPECSRERTKVRTLRSTQSRYPAWQVLIGINVAVFVAELLTGVSGAGTNDHGWVYLHGALFGPSISVNHDYWRLLTAGFLHASLIHIALNMLSLFFVGRILEPAVGSVNFVAIYFASLLAGSFGALLFQPDALTVGASGAIFGVFGALIAVAHARGIPIWQSGLGPVLLINLVFTLSVSNISGGGHIGGLVGGLICGELIVQVGERRRQPRLALAACALVGVIGVIGAIAVAGSAGLTPNGFTI
jgi:membrane associated rhomboid family serine protease